MKKLSWGIVLLLAAVVLIVRPAFPQSKGFIKMQGIQGESTDRGHKDWIDAISVTWDGDKPPAGSVGTRSRTTGPGSFTIVKRLDRASPLLRNKAGVNQKISGVVLETPGTGPDGRRGFWVYKMTDVTIRSIKPSGGGSTVSQESVTLGYAKASVTFTAQKK